MSARNGALARRHSWRNVESQAIEIGGAGFVVRHLASDGEAEICARIMATSEPWLTLRRSYDAALEAVRDATREVYIATSEDTNEIVGFVILNMRGAFVGYIQSVAVRDDWRGRGLGSQLIAFAEARIFREVPNAFILVSSFNDRARSLYMRLGYQVVGELRDYIVPGHSEWLLRKSIAPLADWTTPRSPLAFDPRRASQ
ncbi:MAG TPA: N-acetyltransferase [Gemmatimonadaceae bacterium]